MNRCFYEFSVINGADTRYESQRESCSRIRSNNHLWFHRRSRRCGTLALKGFGKAGFAIEASTHITNTLVAECIPATDAERDIWNFCVVHTLYLFNLHKLLDS